MEKSEDGSVPDFLNLASLKARGWTQASVNRFLGEPDKTKTNPHYRNASPQKLYAFDRVSEAEATSEFSDWLEKSQVRKSAANNVAQRKRAETLDWAMNVEITIPIIDHDELKARSIQHYNRLHSARGNYEKHATAEDDVAFLNRITVNYLRHEMTSYERLLDQKFGLVGAAKAYVVIRERVNSAIIRQYPHLAN